MRTLLISIILLLPTTSPALELQLQKSARVVGEMVRLQDIAHLSGTQSELALGELQLLSAPKLGQQQSLDRKNITRLIERRAGTQQLTWSGAKKVQIERASQLINQEEMRLVLNDFLLAHSVQLPRIDLHYKSMHLPQPFLVNSGLIEHQVIPSKPGVIGSRRMTLLTRVDGQIVSNQSIRVALEALAEVAVATGNLRRGEMLSPANVRMQQQDISKYQQPVFDPEQIYGKQLKRSVRLGQPLLQKQIDFPPTIKRGERITIMALRNGLQLTAAGEARQDGREGETIRVRNVNSHKDVLCRVIAPGQVAVEF